MQKDKINNSIKLNMRAAENLFLICRSNILELNIVEIKYQLEIILNHFKAIFETLKVIENTKTVWQEKRHYKLFPKNTTLLMKKLVSLNS